MQYEIPTTAKVLIMENDAELRTRIKDYLDDSGFDVIEADNGQVGLDIFNKSKPDIVVIALQMPGKSGVEVLDVICKQAPDMPVVAISEPSGLDDVIQALRIGAWDYLTKPIPKIPVLEVAICRALERARLIEENKRYRLELERINLALKKSLDILEQDQEAGRSVQMRLLPEQGMQFGPYRFTHKIAPSLYLSGDFVNYFQINDQQFGFYLADVSGHGASSAFVTVLLKGIMTELLTQYQMYQETLILDPAKVLARLAEEIHSANLGKYITMVYGVLDWTKDKLVYSVGGHYPNPVLLEEGKARFLGGDGFPVGILKETVYKTNEVNFKDNDSLMMFSDGIAEILPRKAMSEKEALLLSMVAEGNGTVDYFVKEFGLADRKELPDDVTLLSLKRLTK